MKQINLRLDQEQAEKINRIGRQLRNTDQGVIRLAIDMFGDSVIGNRRLVIPPPRAIAGRSRQREMTTA